MRKRISYRPYLFLVATLLTLISLPASMVDTLRIFAVASVSPSWHRLDIATASIATFLKIPPRDPKLIQSKDSIDIEKLRLENVSLRYQLEQLREMILNDENLKNKTNRLKEFSQKDDEELFWKDFFKRREIALIQNLDLQYQALPARVIFRDPQSWSSSVWINIGENTNQQIGKTIVAKNSPVLLGTFLIGVVEYVGKKHSRIRLITDSGLSPSVRAIRGAEPDYHMLLQVDALLTQLDSRQELFSHSNERIMALNLLHALKQRLEGGPRQTYYMAKGELHGTSGPLWRMRGSQLKGTGFNYDFEDEEGPARNLRSGVPVGSVSLSATPLLKVGDLLVTTGLDGIFPSDLPVAVITKILPLREGGCAYELEASLCAGNLDKLKYVFVLPPLSVDVLEEEKS